MIKVKRIKTSRGDIDILVNNFIKKLMKENENETFPKHEVKDVKYQMCPYGQNNLDITESALIIYNEYFEV